MGFEAYGSWYLRCLLPCPSHQNAKWHLIVADEQRGACAEAFLVGKVGACMCQCLALRSVGLYCAKINPSWGGVGKPLPLRFFFGSDPLSP